MLKNYTLNKSPSFYSIYQTSSKYILIVLIILIIFQSIIGNTLYNILNILNIFFIFFFFFFSEFIKMVMNGWRTCWFLLVYSYTILLITSTCVLINFNDISCNPRFCEERERVRQKIKKSYSILIWVLAVIKLMKAFV